MQSAKRRAEESPFIREAVRLLLSPVTVRRRLHGTRFVVRFPASQYLGLLKRSGMNYEQALRRHLYAHISPGSLVVDVGANIGLHTLLAASLTGPTGRVHAFEPDPQSNQVLLNNITRNDLANVTVWSCAIGENPGVADLHIDTKTGRTSSLISSHTAPLDKEIRHTLRVPVMALDNLVLDEHGALDFMKIDVEGLELQVLRGATATIARSRPVILVEVARANLEGCVALLESLKYCVQDAERPSLSMTNYSGNVIAIPQH